MANEVNIEKLMLETKQYEFADGLRDIQMGLITASLGAITWLVISPLWITFIYTLRLDFGRWAMATAAIGLYCIFIATALGLRWIITLARHRWLWRDSGMVKASRSIVSTRTTLIASIVFVIGLLVGFRLAPLVEVDEWYAARMLYAAMGWGYGVGLVAFGQDIKVQRYIWLGLLGGVASTLLLFFPLEFGEAGLAFGVGWGAILLASGLVVLLRTWNKSRGASHDG